MTRKKRKKKIRYSEAPSGSVTFYNYKEPFMDYEPGYGFQGVLLVDAKSGLIQCHLCGEWLTAINNAHLRIRHGINATEYKKTVGLGARTALISEKLREKLIQRSQNRKGVKKKKKKMSEETKQKIAESLREYRNSMESRNKEATCPAQLIDRLSKLEKELNHVPAIDDCTFIGSVLAVFGSWENALIRAGMTKRGRGQNVYHRANGRFQYSEENLLKFLTDFKKIHKREPSLSDTRRKMIPSAMTYSRRFGSWKNAKKLAFSK